MLVKKKIINNTDTLGHQACTKWTIRESLTRNTYRDLQGAQSNIQVFIPKWHKWLHFQPQKVTVSIPNHWTELYRIVQEKTKYRFWYGTNGKWWYQSRNTTLTPLTYTFEHQEGLHMACFSAAADTKECSAAFESECALKWGKPIWGERACNMLISNTIFASICCGRLWHIKLFFKLKAWNKGFLLEV